MLCANCGAWRLHFWAEDRGFCNVVCYGDWKLKGRPARINKPSGCSLRKSEPRGPLQGCEEDCLAFEACVELARQEKARALSVL